mmetsp:Transcript_12803/g.36202  ORF Transcript_12803/g.36202 Transcript_12803/m.36202 type:complete len:717 (+) Transcript_12803:224-2374(+)
MTVEQPCTFHFRDHVRRGVAAGEQLDDIGILAGMLQDVGVGVEGVEGGEGPCGENVPADAIPDLAPKVVVVAPHPAVDVRPGEGALLRVDQARGARERGEILLNDGLEYNELGVDIPRRDASAVLRDDNRAEQASVQAHNVAVLTRTGMIKPRNGAWIVGARPRRVRNVPRVGAGGAGGARVLVLEDESMGEDVDLEVQVVPHVHPDDVTHLRAQDRAEQLQVLPLLRALHLRDVVVLRLDEAGLGYGITNVRGPRLADPLLNGIDHRGEPIQKIQIVVQFPVLDEVVVRVVRVAPTYGLRLHVVLAKDGTSKLLVHTGNHQERRHATRGVDCGVAVHLVRSRNPRAHVYRAGHTRHQLRDILRDAGELPGDAAAKVNGVRSAVRLAHRHKVHAGRLPLRGGKPGHVAEHVPVEVEHPVGEREGHLPVQRLGDRVRVGLGHDVGQQVGAKVLIHHVGHHNQLLGHAADAEPAPAAVHNDGAHQAGLGIVHPGRARLVHVGHGAAVIITRSRGFRHVPGVHVLTAVGGDALAAVHLAVRVVGALAALRHNEAVGLDAVRAGRLVAQGDPHNVAHVGANYRAEQAEVLGLGHLGGEGGVRVLDEARLGVDVTNEGTANGITVRDHHEGLAVGLELQVGRLVAARRGVVPLHLLNLDKVIARDARRGGEVHTRRRLDFVEALLARVRQEVQAARHEPLAATGILVRQPHHHIGHGHGGG